MSEAAEEKAPAAPAGIPMKMVIIIVAGVLVLGLGGAFAMFKMMGGPSGEKAQGEGGGRSKPLTGRPKRKAGGMGRCRCQCDCRPGPLYRQPRGHA
jgi:flagellar FliL protein